MSYDTLGSRAINVPQTERRGINLKQLLLLVDFIRDHVHLWVEAFLDISGVGPSRSLLVSGQLRSSFSFFVSSSAFSPLTPLTALSKPSNPRYPGSPNFEQPLELQTFNLYHASYWVIKPATLRYICSFVELVAKDADTQFPCWFVSHAWQEAVCRFVACLHRHAELRNALELSYWICAYANNQHKLKECCAHISWLWR